MIPGQTIMIYSDPFWIRYPEGLAKLIKLVSVHDESYEYWQVEFLDQPDKLYQRLIKKI
jgi:hypothetical protein